MNHQFIYSNQLYNFQRFSEREDFNKNLKNCMLSLFKWDNLSVLEAGVGMGRVTDYYFDKVKHVTLTDESKIMLEYCRSKYSTEKDKVSCCLCSHSELPKMFQAKRFDIFVSAYSLSYECIKRKGNKLQDYINNLFSLANRFVIIENTGVFCSDDSYIQPYAEYFNILSSHLAKIEIQTDFRFKSTEEAVYYCGLFFGETIASKIKQMDINVVPETTCIWYNG